MTWLGTVHTDCGLPAFSLSLSLSPLPPSVSLSLFLFLSPLLSYFDHPFCAIPLFSLFPALRTWFRLFSTTRW